MTVLGGARAAAFDPNARRLLELQEQVKLEDDENGDPLRPRVTIHSEPRE